VNGYFLVKRDIRRYMNISWLSTSKTRVTQDSHLQEPTSKAPHACSTNGPYIVTIGKATGSNFLSSHFSNFITFASTIWVTSTTTTIFIILERSTILASRSETDRTSNTDGSFLQCTSRTIPSRERHAFNNAMNRWPYSSGAVRES